MTKDPHKLAGRLLDSDSIGDPDDDVGRAFRVLMAVAEARYGAVHPEVIIGNLFSCHGRKTKAAVVKKKTKAA